MLLYTMAVILWGTFVRASLAGDGCGAHWPLCNGEVIPGDAPNKTFVELAHRITSGLDWFGALGLWLLARRTYARGAPPRVFAFWTFVLMCTEAIVGAILVLLRLVASNPDLVRAWWMGGHLINTFLLLAMLVFTLITAHGGHAPRLRASRPLGNLLAFGALSVLLLGMTGALTALGDTIFPAETLAEGLRQDLDPDAHLFVRLRAWHPVAAIGLGGYLLFLAGTVASRRREPLARRAAAALAIAVVSQVGIGIANILLLAPVWMQLIHLFAADLIWLSLLVLWAAGTAPEPEPEPEPEPGY